MKPEQLNASPARHTALVATTIAAATMLILIIMATACRTGCQPSATGDNTLCAIIPALIFTILLITLLFIWSGIDERIRSAYVKTNSIAAAILLLMMIPPFSFVPSACQAISAKLPAGSGAITGGATAAGLLIAEAIIYIAFTRSLRKKEESTIPHPSRLKLLYVLMILTGMGIAGYSLTQLAANIQFKPPADAGRYVMMKAAETGFASQMILLLATAMIIAAVVMRVKQKRLIRDLSEKEIASIIALRAKSTISEHRKANILSSKAPRSLQTFNRNTMRIAMSILLFPWLLMKMTWQPINWAVNAIFQGIGRAAQAAMTSFRHIARCRPHIPIKPRPADIRGISRTKHELLAKLEENAEEAENSLKQTTTDLREIQKAIARANRQIKIYTKDSKDIKRSADFLRKDHVQAELQTSGDEEINQLLAKADNQLAQLQENTQALQKEKEELLEMSRGLATRSQDMEKHLSQYRRALMTARNDMRKEIE